MLFSEEFLRKLVESEVMGEFPPFNTGTIGQVEAYIGRIVARLQENRQLSIEADFTSYGSGFASYVNIKVSKQDQSDTQFRRHGEKVIEETNGLLLYLSTLVPYWFYGGSRWTLSRHQGQVESSSGSFLEPNSFAHLSPELWYPDVKAIESVLKEFQYQLLDPEVLAQPAPTGLEIPTILADKPYQIFDCFFYWED